MILGMIGIIGIFGIYKTIDNMKKKILVTGTTGMLGSMVFNYLRRNPNFEVFSFNRGTSESVFLDKYDYCINCVGVIKPFIKNETREEIMKAIEGNIWYPYALAARLGIGKFISIATDCVFDGKTEWHYTESSKHNAEDVYGKTKSLGEIKQDNWYNLRCSIIGPEAKEQKNSLLEWVLAQNGDVKGFTDHKWNGITTLQFAKIIENIVENDIELNHFQHIVPWGVVSKRKLLQIIKEEYDLDINVLPVESGAEINRVLGTNDEQANEKLWPDGNRLTIKEMVKELSEYI